MIGGRDKLVEWQDKFHEHMAAEFPELERGQYATVTRRKHIPTWLYKQSHRLTQEMVEIRAELEQAGTLNAKKQREKILKLLDKWYPQINAFEAKLKPYDEQLQRMRDELIRSRSTMFRALDTQEESQQQNLELMDELRACQVFIDSIPQDLLEQIKQRQAQRMERGHGQQFRM